MSRWSADASDAALRPRGGGPDDAIVLPRGLIFLAALWLVGAWMVSIGTSAPLQPSALTYTPGIRRFLDGVAIGIVVVWPLARLTLPWSGAGRSAPPNRATILGALLDAVTIGLLAQMVVWPLRLVTPWSVARTALIDAALLGWVLLVAALLAVAAGTRSWIRASVMVLLLGLALAPPLGWSLAFSPEDRAHNAQRSPPEGGALAGAFVTVRNLSGGGPAPLAPSEQAAALTPLLAGVAAWVALLLVAAARQRRYPPADVDSRPLTPPPPAAEAALHSDRTP